MTKTQQPNMAFFGTPNFVVPILEKLVNNNFSIKLVVTQSDKPKGRSKKNQACPVKIWAENHSLKVLTPVKLDEKFLKELSANSISLAIVAAYGKIIPDKIINTLPYGFLNIHPSLLPKYRGASPLQGAILNNETTSGVTLMKIDDKMDHGPILAKIKLDLNPSKYIQELQSKYFKAGADLLINSLPDYLANKIKLTPQNHNQATFTKLIKKSDGRINWELSAEKIYNQIRAYNNWPGSFTNWNNQQLTITKSSIFNKNENNMSPGKIARVNNSIIVGTGCGYLELLTVKLAGKQDSSINDFVHGHKNFINSILI